MMCIHALLCTRGYGYHVVFVIFVLHIPISLKKLWQRAESRECIFNGCAQRYKVVAPSMSGLMQNIAGGFDPTATRKPYGRAIPAKTCRLPYAVHDMCGACSKCNPRLPMWLRPCHHRFPGLHRLKQEPKPAHHCRKPTSVAELARRCTPKSYRCSSANSIS